MPSQRGSGFRGIPWSRSDRNGFDYPLDRMSMQNGLLMTPEEMDDPLMWYRDRLIAEVIGDEPTEAQNITAKVRSDPNDEYYER